ncbi:PREDICTED: uncharacterized protein LOC106111112 [Papilio polytes]|uniref:uncharacterized protein LOC106111112 n=1 Tax=Papilio polytes TaxID=76194 RepID=UPI0006763ACC|nr:PREDICTED: uncharacterized protein LOC106111112 [Papilio polytes]
MEITVRQNRTAVRFGPNKRNNNTITGRIGSFSANERITFNAIDLVANLTLGPTGYTVDDMRILFLPVDNDLSYNITASDRDSGDRIKNWLSNKLPVVVDTYEASVDQLTNAGVLTLNDSLL